MASLLNRTMEKMGWRMPEETEELGADVHQYPFSSSTERETFTVEEKAAPVIAAPKSPQRDQKRLCTLHPRTFGDAATVASYYREGIPVIMNLTDMDDGEARRIVDFACGLSSAVGGKIEQITARVFVLAPADTEVAKGTPGGSAGLYR